MYFAVLIYPLKNTTYTDRSALHLDLHFEIDSEGRLRAKLYYKRDDFNNHIVNFPIIFSNILAASAYGVYISHLIRYFRVCGSYHDFFDIGLLLTSKLLKHGFIDSCTVATMTWLIYMSQMTMDMFHLS
jgi:hypothetical protein